MAGGYQFVTISAKESRACGLTAAGAAYCWGALNLLWLATSNAANPWLANCWCLAKEAIPLLHM